MSEEVKSFAIGTFGIVAVVLAIIAAIYFGAQQSGKQTTERVKECVSAGSVGVRFMYWKNRWMTCSKTYRYGSRSAGYSPGE